MQLVKQAGDVTIRSAYPLLVNSIADARATGFRVWLDERVTTSPASIAFMCIGHTALGMIVGMAFLEWLP